MNDQNQQYTPPQPQMPQQPVQPQVPQPQVPQQPQPSLYAEQIQDLQAQQRSQVPQSYAPQQGYGQPYSQRMYQPVSGAVYYMEESDKTLRLVAFILNVISTVVAAFAIIPLAWMIPMSIRSWKIYKGTKPNTTAFGVCTLLFVSLIGGILLLISKKDR